MRRVSQFFCCYPGWCVLCWGTIAGSGCCVLAIHIHGVTSATFDCALAMLTTDLRLPKGWQRNKLSNHFLSCFSFFLCFVLFSFLFNAEILILDFGHARQMFNTLRHKPRHCVTLFLFLARVCTWRHMRMCTHVYSCLHVCTYVCRCACMYVYIAAGDQGWHGEPSLYSLYLMYWGSCSLISKLTISTMDSFLLPSLCSTTHKPPCILGFLCICGGELNCSQLVQQARYPEPSP